MDGNEKTRMNEVNPFQQQFQQQFLEQVHSHLINGSTEKSYTYGLYYQQKMNENGQPRTNEGQIHTNNNSLSKFIAALLGDIVALGDLVGDVADALGAPPVELG